MITVREATGGDVPAIREIFLATYGTDYTDPRYYDESLLTRLVYSENSLMLVAEDTAIGRVVGTASVDFEVGAYSDLVGEFGRLAVHPDARQQGIGRLLMAERIRRVQDRLQVGIVEARARPTLQPEDRRGPPVRARRLPAAGLASARAREPGPARPVLRQCARAAHEPSPDHPRGQPARPPGPGELLPDP